MRSSSEHKRGQRSKGKTFAVITRKEPPNEAPSTGCEKASKSGARSATARFICIVYDMSDAELPPSLAVITDAAVAVGHTRHSIAVSTRSCTL